VLRLWHDLGLLQQEIARSCSIGQSSVHRYLERASAAGLSWPLPEDCDDRRLNELLFPAEPTGEKPPTRAPVDFAEIQRQLQNHKHVTLQLLWEEYRQAQPDGYRYSPYTDTTGTSTPNAPSETRPRTMPRTYLPSWIGRVRYSTSVSGYLPPYRIEGRNRLNTVPLRPLFCEARQR
jgi:hypothetical protein